MKNLKKCPLLLLIFFTGVLFTIVAAVGKQNIYADQEYDPLKAPLLSVLFTGVQDDIYPWQMLSGAEPVSAQKASKENDVAQGNSDQQEQSVPGQDGAASPVAGTEKNTTEAEQSGQDATEAGQSAAQPGQDATGTDQNAVQSGGDVTGTGQSATQPGQDATGTDQSAAQPGQNATGAGQKGTGNDNAAKTPAVKPLERLQPLRESTYEEYINHISADIYGDAGAVRAAEYPFETVTEDYFDDALFIGDSRTVGLRDYTDLAEHADFYCETSLTIYKVLEESFKGKGTILEALSKKNYGKIYLMVGINELGRGTTEDFMAKYTEVVDTLHELCPDAKIMIQGIMHVSEKKSSSDAIFNNSNINARNNAIATLADNVHFFYIDMNEAVCDENGNLNAEYTHDQIHLLGMYNDLWKQFLLEHGVEG